MIEIRPMIKTFDEAIEQITNYGKPRMALFVDAEIEALVLKGGSIKHPTTISLIKSINSNNMFGHYKSVENLRMVIKDDIYRTKYGLNQDEFNQYKSKMLVFAIERTLTITLRSKDHNPGFVVGKGMEWDLFDGRFNLRIPMTTQAYLNLDKPKVGEPQEDIEVCGPQDPQYTPKCPNCGAEVLEINEHHLILGDPDERHWVCEKVDPGQEKPAT